MVKQPGSSSTLADLQLVASRSDRPAHLAAHEVSYAPQAAERLAFLDALRGIAALSVFFYHAGLISQFGPISVSAPFLNLGNFGVILFFLCSGFIIPFSLERQGSLRRFWIRRIARLYPPYWASVALYVAIGLGLRRGESIGPLLADPLQVTLANLTMFQPLFGQPSLNYGYWTLLFEMLFYFLVSALFITKLIRRTALIAELFCLAAILVEAILPQWFGAPKPVLGLVGFLATMFLGTIFYRIHTQELSARQAAPALILGGAMLVTTALSVPNGEHGIWEFIDHITARLLALAVFSYAFISRSRTVPGWLRFLGEISYSVYLMHMVVVSLVRFDSPLLTMLVWTVGVILLSSLTYWAIERPAMRLGRWLS